MHGARRPRQAVPSGPTECSSCHTPPVGCHSRASQDMSSRQGEWDARALTQAQAPSLRLRSINNLGDPFQVWPCRAWASADQVSESHMGQTDHPKSRSQAVSCHLGLDASVFCTVCCPRAHLAKLLALHMPKGISGHIRAHSQQ